MEKMNSTNEHIPCASETINSAKLNYITSLAKLYELSASYAILRENMLERVSSCKKKPKRELK